MGENIALLIMCRTKSFHTALTCMTIAIGMYYHEHCHLLVQVEGYCFFYAIQSTKSENVNKTMECNM